MCQLIRPGKICEGETADMHTNQILDKTHVGQLGLHILDSYLSVPNVRLY